jgi:hypothetical protein
MSWSHAAKASADEAAVSSSRAAMAHIRDRAASDPAFASGLRLGLADLFYALWPPGRRVSVVEYLAVVVNDLDRMPLDLINRLCDALSAIAQRSRRDDPAASAAAYLLCGWLRARALELAADFPARQAAKKAKTEHALFLKHLLQSRRAAVA